MVFEKTTGVYERIYRFITKCLKKNEKYANKKYILLALNLKNDDIISYRPGLKMDVKNEIFWSEIRSRFGELCSTPPPRISRSTPPPPTLPCARYSRSNRAETF